MCGWEGTLPAFTGASCMYGSHPSGSDHTVCMMVCVVSLCGWTVGHVSSHVARPALYVCYVCYEALYVCYFCYEALCVCFAIRHYMSRLTFRRYPYHGIHARHNLRAKRERNNIRPTRDEHMHQRPTPRTQLQLLQLLRQRLSEFMTNQQRIHQHVHRCRTSGRCRTR